MENIITQVTELLRTNPGMKISIEGHSDNSGSAGANQKLSEDRAAALVKQLIEQGIDKDRLLSKGWCGTKPIADNTTDEGKARNRRVEIIKR